MSASYREEGDYQPLTVVRGKTDPSPHYRRIMYECPKCGDIECQRWPRSIDDKGKARPDVTITDRCIPCVRKAIGVLAIALFLCTTAWADPAKAVITGPTEGVPGDLIELDSSESIGQKQKWYVEPTRFPDGKPTFKISKDGGSMQLATRPGSYRIELIVSNEEGPDRAIWIVTIGGAAPKPPDVPSPVVPTPLPAGKYDLANFTRAQVLANVSADKRSLCSAFSGNFGSVAAQIAAGTIKTIPDANAKLKALNQATAGANAEFWKNAVLAAVAGKLNEIAKTGATLQDFGLAFQEIRDGFAASVQ